MTVKLPQELVDAILDYFAGDSESLKTCSLVCCAWVSRSRSYLFERCTLLPTNIVLFRDLLRSPCCTFLLHLRSIYAHRFYWHPHDHCFSEIAADLQLADVRTLEVKIRVGNAPNLDEFFLTGFFTAFPKATHVFLSWDFAGPQPAALVDMICLFPALQELHIREMSGTVADPRSSALPPQGLQSLNLSARSTHPILAWLHAFNLPNVNSVALNFLERSHIHTVRAALQQLGGALHHLDITLTWCIHASDCAYIHRFVFPSSAQSMITQSMA